LGTGHEVLRISQRGSLLFWPEETLNDADASMAANVILECI
jgi:hypothetical protein